MCCQFGQETAGTLRFEMDFQVKYDLYDTTSGTWVSIPNLDYHHAKYLRLSVPSGATMMEISYRNVNGTLDTCGELDHRPDWLTASYHYGSDGSGDASTDVSSDQTHYLMVLGKDDPGPSSGEVRLRLGCGNAIWTDDSNHFSVSVAAGSTSTYNFFVGPGEGALNISIPCSLGSSETLGRVTDPGGGTTDMDWNGTTGAWTYSDDSPQSGCWTITLINGTASPWNTGNTATLTQTPGSAGGWSQPTEGSGTWRWEVETNT